MKFFLFAFLFSISAFAYDLKDKTQLHGVLWAKFTQRLDTDKTPKSGFDIYRGFLIIDNNYNEKWSSQIIGDLRTTGSTLNPIDAQNGKATASLFRAELTGNSVFIEHDQLRFGLQRHDLLVYVYGELGHRWIIKEMYHDAGFLGSHQSGASYALGVGKKFNISYQINNSAQTHGKNTDNNIGQSITLKYHLGKKVTLLLSDDYSTGNTRQNVLNVGSIFRGKKFKVFVHASQRKKEGLGAENGFSTTFTTDYQSPLGLFGRFFTGNTRLNRESGADHVFTLGPTYKIASKLKAGIFYEGRDTIGSRDEQIVSFAIAGAY